MPEILTDVKILRQHSAKANDLEVGDIVQQLSVSIPETALGLSAPQIGIQKRVFIANLTSGSFAFVNPTLIWKSPDKSPSEEGCLSIPGVTRCLPRYSQISVSCDKLINIRTNELEVDAEIRLNGRDSFIVQHENDHLDGVLIIDREQTRTYQQRQSDAEEERRKRINASRLKKQLAAKPKPEKPQKISAKRAAKIKREATKRKRKDRTVRRQNKIRVEIAERHKMEILGLFAKSETTSKDDESPE